ncbi:MAG: radical SAM protein [Bacteroidota bacterium]
MNVNAFLNTVTNAHRTLPLVILYVTEGCNMQCTMCSYRDPLPNELALAEIETLATDLVSHGLRHIVYSGGEPLLRRDFDRICAAFHALGVRQSLLTNGLLLEKRADLAGCFEEIIVSLDGPTAKVHDTIRRTNAFGQILRGISRVRQTAHPPTMSIRTVVQKANYRHLPEMVHFARSLGVGRISFLAADVLSSAFGRGTVSSPDPALMLSEEEATDFRAIVERMTNMFREDFDSHFIAESPSKMFHLVQYFEALLGKSSFPLNRCNAPMVSAVITSTGDVHPCFFLPSLGNLRHENASGILESPQAGMVRKDVRQYRLDRCKTCVCTLHVSPGRALFDRF